MIIVSEEGKIVNFDNVESIEILKRDYGTEEEDTQYQIIAKTHRQDIILGITNTFEKAENCLINFREYYIEETKYKQLIFKNENEAERSYADNSEFCIADNIG